MSDIPRETSQKRTIYIKRDLYTKKETYVNQMRPIKKHAEETDQHYE